MRHIIILFLLFFTEKIIAESLSQKDVRAAIQENDFQLIDSLLKDDSRITSIFKDSSMGILHMAIYFDKPDIYKKIIVEYSQLTKVEMEKSLITACATNKKNRDAIILLIKKGIDIDTKIRNKNCLYTAVISADYEFYMFLIENGANPNVKVKPHKVFGFKEEVSIKQIIDTRIKKYQKMKNAEQQ